MLGMLTILMRSKIQCAKASAVFLPELQTIIWKIAFSSMVQKPWFLKIKKLGNGGRYKVRTCDFLDVDETLYH